MASSFNNEGLLLGIAVAGGQDNQGKMIAGIQASQFRPGSPAMVGAVLMKKQFDRVTELESELNSVKMDRDRLKATPASSPLSGGQAASSPTLGQTVPFGSGLSTGASSSAAAAQPPATPLSAVDATVAFMALALSNMQNENAELKAAIRGKASDVFDLARYMTPVPVLPAHSNSPPMHDKYLTSYNQAITQIVDGLKDKFIAAFSINYPAPAPPALAPAAGSAPPAPATPSPPAAPTP